MQFANVRSLKVQTARVLALSAKKGPVIITRRGQPFAVLRALDPDAAWKEFDGLWKRLREAGRRAGYKRGAVDRLITEVRKAR